MDPTRLTLIGAGAGLLAAVLIVGPYALIAVLTYDGDEDPELVEQRHSMPAAQEALQRGFKDQDAAYKNEAMRMVMRAYGPGDVLFTEGEVAHDPESGDFLMEFYMELGKMAEAYGLEPEDLQEDPSSEGAQDELGLDLFDFGDETPERLGFVMGQKGAVKVFDFMGMNMTSRDHSPADDEFELIGSDDPEAEASEGFGVATPDMFQELQLFLEEDNDTYDHSIEASTYQGDDSWLVEARFQNDTSTGEGKFHFRQHDLAPLYVEFTIEGLFDSDTLDMIREDDPDFPLDDMPMRMVMEFEYGAVDIQLPEGFNRFAVDVKSDHESTGGDYAITITQDHEQLVPLDELEVHVVVEQQDIMQFASFDEFEEFESDEGLFSGGGPDVTQVLAAFDLADGTEHGETNGYTLSYLDNDGDGMISAGDQAVVRGQDDAFWDNGTHRVTVLFYDKWAEAYEGAPAPGLALLLGLLAATGIAIRRKRRSAGAGEAETSQGG